MEDLKITPKITDRSYNFLAYMQEVKKYRNLTPEDEVNLSKRILEGDESAVNELAQSNLKFVVSVAKQYHGKGLELMDLINEGNIGLIKAASRFDHSKGFKFISYAVWWIRQSILNALTEKGRLVQVSKEAIFLTKKVNDWVIGFMQEHEREPNENDFDDCVKKLMEKDAKLTTDAIKKAINILFAGGKHASLDAPIMNQDDEEATYLDLQPSDEPLPDEQSVHYDSLKQEVERSLKLLDSKQAGVLKMYFGIGVKEPMTLEDIAKKYGLTRERARQIKEKALEILREKGSENLKKFLAN